MRMTHVRRIVSEYYGLTLAELTQVSRKPEFALPRQIGMYFCRKLTRASLNEVVRFFKRTNHTTVLYAVNKIEELRVHPKTGKELIELEELIVGSSLHLNNEGRE